MDTAPSPSRSRASSTASSLSSGASSLSSSLRSRRSSNLTLDLSGLPPAAVPADNTNNTTSTTAPTPSNTLLFTNLNHADVFRPDNLETIRDLVNQSATLHSWAPLRSFRRIVASFYSASDAAQVRAVWDGEQILGSTCHVYYGRPTSLAPSGDHEHLALPDAGKLFFISPPPSPPMGWEMRLEGAPNKQVHAEDLADALAKLHHQATYQEEEAVAEPGQQARGEDVAMRSPVSEPPSATAGASSKSPKMLARAGRSRSSTLVIYQPQAHSSHPDLPAIAVEDMTDASTDELLNNATWLEKPILAHTARPPVELMNDA